MDFSQKGNSMQSLANTAIYARMLFFLLHVQTLVVSSFDSALKKRGKYHTLPPRPLQTSLQCKRILGARNLVRVRNIVVAAIFDFMTMEDWGE